MSPQILLRCFAFSLWDPTRPVRHLRERPAVFLLLACGGALAAIATGKFMVVTGTAIDFTWLRSCSCKDNCDWFSAVFGGIGAGIAAGFGLGGAAPATVNAAGNGVQVGKPGAWRDAGPGTEVGRDDFVKVPDGATVTITRGDGTTAEYSVPGVIPGRWLESSSDSAGAAVWFSYGVQTAASYVVGDAGKDSMGNGPRA